MNKQIILDPFQNVVASGVAVCDCSKLLGSVLEKITLTLGGGLTKSTITNLALKANGKIVFESDAPKLEASNAYRIGSSDPLVLKLDFMDRRARTTNAWQAGAYDLSAKSGITSLRLEVTTNGATNPSLVGFADVSPPTDTPEEAGIRWLMTRRHRATYAVGSAGQFNLPIPHLDPAGGGSNYRAIYIYSANITAFKTQRDGITEHELTAAQNAAAQRDNFRTPQSNLLVFDPVQDGQLQGRTWDTRKATNVGSAQFYATFSAAETITIETEELLPFAAF